ncbi:MAG: glycoside hydrolase family 5 protein [Proteobacteria bacterium]|nr:glycoside hydrolase family 5 protein [Pseudomonadota bacterium]MCP4922101.1 glycoside hydrolase family 5 protein [Pseudomonadota bacterium]
MIWLVLGCGMRPAKECTIAQVEPARLRTDGTLVVDELDRTVLLRGVNAGGRSKFAPYVPFDGDFDEGVGAYLDRPEAWGFDVLRVPFSWAAAEPSRGEWDEAWMARYDALLDAAHERGMWTIVDFHQDVYAEAFCGDGFPAWTLPEDPGEPRHDCPGWFTGYTQDDRVDQAFEDFWGDTHGARTDFEAMWSVMAARHADRPGVIGFEIMNEPHGSADELTPFYEELTDVIRAEAPDSLVFFDATGTDGVNASTDLARPDRDGLVFAPHFYTPGALFGGGLGDVAPAENWADVGEDWDLPVLVGEFGIDAGHGSDITPYMTEHYDIFDARGMHATYWEYSDSSELWNEEDLSLVGPDGEEREDMLAAIVRPYPRALVGGATWSFDGSVLRLELPATEVVTELSVPGLGEVWSDSACVQWEGPILRVLAEEASVVEVRL